MNAAPKYVSEAMKLVQLALLIISLAIIVAPPTRSPTVHSVQTTLLAIECGWLVYKAWRRNLLKVTPESSVGRLMETGRVTSGHLERSSVLAGFLAVLVQAFWQQAA